MRKTALIGLLVLALSLLATAQGPPSASATSIGKQYLVQPEELVKLLQAKGDKPLVLQVGPRTMYAQAHVPGAEFIGGASSEAGRARLEARLKSVPHGQLIVLYCGCCPWERCPNIAPALQTAQALGFTKVKVMYIADNFGTNWVDKGYPTAKGEQ